jgi:hypothetical protein
MGNKHESFIDAKTLCIPLNRALASDVYDFYEEPKPIPGSA